ncbi:MAG: IS1595 family transposase [Bacteroidia bacterium]|nr:IS1595 family transposase [Bacteroidia bacterium]
MAKYTLEQFRADYPNDAVCLDKIFKVRFGDLRCCPKCGRETTFKRIPTRKSYQCRLCYYQIYPCAGTPLENTRTPLNYWLYAMYLMTTTRTGVSAKELERILGVTYKTAWRMNMQIRKIMSAMQNRKFTGIVEVDEVYLGSTYVRKGAEPKDKKPVIGIVERLGEVRGVVVDKVNKETIYPILDKNIDKSATVNTDEAKVYLGLEKDGFEKHHIIRHLYKCYRKGAKSTNTVEGWFSQIRRMYATHIHISEKYLQNYINEAAFRYNHRFPETPMFENLVLNLSLFDE